ncbi:hypothetical protein HBI25_054760 [Parastagonospora nodorum]|nr:hypothetical protein HBH53_184930 [Parastagonospora nodorum]KAH3997350.1 hypothetical protein HBI10_144150 [Parastagonospora nodorum]KAH4021167.1 hypothetical protein HBI13_112450 [Parastagonospora nodorum]KAH4037048.1 hypothetical protein HBI09_065220 [Parastagonospora nodorum]KAH4196099.1 hypothetical protein HBH42_081580 [Parastagonospora nodorum]
MFIFGAHIGIRHIHRHRPSIDEISLTATSITKKKITSPQKHNLHQNPITTLHNFQLHPQTLARVPTAQTLSPPHASPRPVPAVQLSRPTNLRRRAPHAAS